MSDAKNINNSVTTCYPESGEYIIAKANTPEDNDWILNGPQIEELHEYIILYDEYSEDGRYRIIRAKNIVEACRLWYEYNCGKMVGVILKVWEKFKPEEFGDCIAWVNSLLYHEYRIDHIIHGMYQYANPSKEE